MLLSFGKVKKTNNTASGGGMYVQNMSQKDMDKWKAKKVGGKDPRIEIRKTVSGFDPAEEEKRLKRGWGHYNNGNNCNAQILAIVRPDGSVVLSANGRMAFKSETWADLFVAVDEAVQALNDGTK